MLASFYWAQTGAIIFFAFDNSYYLLSTRFSFFSVKFAFLSIHWILISNGALAMPETMSMKKNMTEAMPMVKFPYTVFTVFMITINNKIKTKASYWANSSSSVCLLLAMSLAGDAMTREKVAQPWKKAMNQLSHHNRKLTTIRHQLLHGVIHNFLFKNTRFSSAPRALMTLLCLYSFQSVNKKPIC